MTTLYPYVFFGGRCEEALARYSDALGGRVKTMMRLGEVNPGTAEEHKRWIIHSELEVDGRVLLMAGDGVPSAPPAVGPGQVSLALAFDTVDELERVFAKLSDGGEVLRPVHDTFYDGKMGVVRDAFGVSWMLNWSPPAAR